jgi:glycosyl transferase family 25
MEIPVFVISLKRSADRRAHTTGRLNQLGIPFQIIDAFDGAELSNEEVQNNSRYGIFKTGLYSRHLMKAEIGCYFSHLKIFKKMADENMPVACVLEDDNDYSDDFKELLNPENISMSDWDILYLGHRSGSTDYPAQSIKKKRLKLAQYCIGEPIEIPHGSHAYLIKNGAAAKLSSNVFPVIVPFDLYIGNTASTRIRTSLLSPPAAITNSSFVSTIQNDLEIRPEKKILSKARQKVKQNMLLFRFFHNIWYGLRTCRNSFPRYLRKRGIIRNIYANN